MLSSDDDEFVNGAPYVYERKKRKRKTGEGAQAITGGGRKGGSKGGNPLLKFLSDEPIIAFTEKEPVKSTATSKAKNASSSSSTKTVSSSTKKEPKSGSETESDPEADLFIQRIKEERAKTEAATEESVTEEDDDEEFQNALRRQRFQDEESRANRHDARPLFITTSEHPWQGSYMLDSERNISVPGSINRYLREYQRDGIKFLYEKWKEGRGGVLGDDMGLGKTIQVISFLSAIMKKTGDDRDRKRRYKHVRQLQDNEDWRRTLPKANATWSTCLIIAPSTVVHNWKRELETWGYFEVGDYTGSQRQEVLDDFKLGRLDIVVTSFDTARMEIDKLDNLPWSCIFVDEAHRIKNMESQTTRAFNRFECQIRFGMTGTAIQNDYAELWTVLDWSNPGRLGTKDQWTTAVTLPLKVGQSQKASEEELAIARTLAARLVHKLLPNFFLRRTKALIADQMPQKYDEVVFCPMTDRQINAYKKFQSACGEKPKKGDILRFCAAFMKLSNHLAMILPGPTDSPEQIEINREMAKIAFPEGLPSYGLSLFDPSYCGKLSVLELLLNEWRKANEEQNKVLIFSRSVRLLEILEYHVKRRSFKFCLLDGRTKQSDRMPMIDKFNNDPEVFIFLISTLAGGTGLNLTAANKVVIFDPNWNPAHDLQAIDRAFRIGQHRNVSIYRLLAAGSIEEHIYRRQIYKQQQMAIGYEASAQTRYFEGVQGYKGKEGDLFGWKNLFSLGGRASATKMTIERANKEQFMWALANMESYSTSQDEVALSQVSSVGEGADLEDLRQLLFDEKPKSVKCEGDSVLKILNSVGVEYSHANEVLLRPSHVENKVTEHAIEKHRQRKAEAANKRKHVEEEERHPTPQWPPVRKKTKGLAAKARLQARKEALLALGYMEDWSEIDKFAIEFNFKTPEQQQEIMGKLDDWSSIQYSRRVKG